MYALSSRKGSLNDTLNISHIITDEFSSNKFYLKCHESVISEEKELFLTTLEITFNCRVSVVTIQEDRNNYFIQSLFLIFI